MRPVEEAPRISVVIPALDEEQAIGQVLGELPWDHLHEVVVADNGSTDATAAVARRAGARVVMARPRGYGSACLAGLAALSPGGPDDLVVFLDADHSDHPEELPRLVTPLLEGRADLVIGSRVLGRSEPGSLLPQQRFGNWLATGLVRLLFGHRYTDLGPFRALRRDALERLGMCDPDFGWTVEMQVRALQAGLVVTECPVSYRCRVGRSKIAGTLRGSLAAGVKILSTIGVLWWRGRRRAPGAGGRDAPRPRGAGVSDR